MSADTAFFRNNWEDKVKIAGLLEADESFRHGSS